MSKSGEMGPSREQLRLADFERRYQALASELAEVGFIHGGSIVHRYTRCANPRCRCRADPPQLHGPYWQWTGKLAGKTVTRRLSEAEAARYSEWIANDRRLRQLVTGMRRIADEAITLILGREELRSGTQAANRRTRVMRQPVRPHNRAPDETPEVTT
ncbi:MAG: DUF6788 family protein [Acidimicrobiales bacterium]